MDLLLQASLGLLAFLFFCTILCSSWTRPEKTLVGTEPPQAPGAWPLLGHVHLILHLLKGQDFFETIASMANKYGPIFMLRLGKRRVLVVSSLEGVKECFTTNDQFLANLQSSSIIRYLGYKNLTLGHAPSGPYWRDMRKLTVVHLLSNSRLEAFKHIRAAVIDEHMKGLYKLWKKNGQSYVRIGVKKWFQDFTFKEIVRIVAGKQFGMDDDVEGEEFKSWIDRYFHYITMLIAASDVVPFPEWMDWKGQVKGMKRVADELDSIIGRYVEEHRRRRGFGGAMSDEDIIDVLLSAVDKPEFSNNDPDKIIKAAALSLILGATDSSAATMSVTLSFLLNNPDVLRKAQEELDIHVGKDRNVDESDIKNLKYLQAIVKESLRLSPSSMFLTPRQAVEDCRIGGFHVQAGTCVLAYSGRVHRDPGVWSDPLVFKPERFLAEHAGMDVRGQHFELLPFGTGRRSCPGISFALQTMHLALARLLHGFEPARPSDAPMDVGSLRLGNPKSAAVNVLLAPRLHGELYE